MVRRGFSTVASNLIFFIGAVLAVSVAVTSITVMLRDVQYAMEQRALHAAEKAQTILEIVEGSADGSYLWVYLKNLGKTTLDVDSFTVFINGRMVGHCNSEKLFCTDESRDYVLTPGEILEVNVAYPTQPGSYTVKIVAGNGSTTDPYTVVVT